MGTGSRTRTFARIRNSHPRKSLTEWRKAKHGHVTPELLAALTEPGASIPDEGSVASHLAVCRHCMAVWSEFVRARTQFSLRSDADMPPDSLLAVAKRIAPPSPARSAPATGLATHRRVVAALMSLAAAILFLVLTEPRPALDPDMVHHVSEILREDSGGIVYASELAPVMRGTRGSEQGPEDAELDLLVKLHAEHPKSAEVAWWLVAAHLAENRKREADLYLQNALQQFPEDARFHNLAAILAYRRDDLQAAERELRKARAMEPSPAVLINLATVLKEQGHPDEAEALLTEVVRNYPGEPVTDLARKQIGTK